MTSAAGKKNEITEIITGSKNIKSKAHPFLDLAGPV